jgi:4-hydroxybenzoate polyprenyltransferase
MRRLWIYQRERFPLLAHGILIAAFSFSAVSFSALLRGVDGFPGWTPFVVAFVGAFCFFLQLRVADEFKDSEEDSRWRPYRPVPRGLVTLRELAVVAGSAALLQGIVSASLSWRLLLLSGLVWCYLALMTREFFVRDWIRPRPVTYLWTHMLILPLVDFYATACDWSRLGSNPPAGLFWFLALSFFNGVALEIGRKVRAPEEEEAGVRTYTVLWGPRAAALAWLGALVATGGCALAAAARIDFAGPVAAVLGLALVAALWLGLGFAASPTSGRARWIDRLSGLWTLLLYLSLGAVPLLLRISKGSL